LHAFAVGPRALAYGLLRKGWGGSKRESSENSRDTETEILTWSERGLSPGEVQQLEQRSRSRLCFRSGASGPVMPVVHRAGLELIEKVIGNAAMASSRSVYSKLNTPATVSKRPADDTYSTCLAVSPSLCRRSL
jgi:hypothetical protein